MRDPVGRYKGYPFKQSPVNIKFVDKKLRVGLLPQIEVELMANRDIAKKQAKEAGEKQDTGAANMYDKRQNEIKIICNSVYGIMTASGGRLTRMELGESVTSQGRLMIMTAKGISESLLTKMGHEKAGTEDFKVIYGYDYIPFQILS
jgi:DNA polymerase elongation subunit (family B)